MIHDPSRADRYRKQALFQPLGAEGDARLREATALVVGCGALGTNVATQLARAGVGRLRLVDRDLVEWTNLHRQVGFTERDARERSPKAIALAARLGEANSEVALEPVVADFTSGNARELGAGADVFLDGSDNLPTRFLMNDLALELERPWVYGGAVGEDARAQLFVPGEGPCLRCLLPELPPPGSLPTCDTSGVLGPAAAAAASFQAALAVRALARPESVAELAGILVRLSLWEPEASTCRVLRDPECPACVGGERTFLDGRHVEGHTILCGREAVQIVPARGPGGPIELEALAERLGTAGEVELRPFLLRFRPSETTAVAMTVFPDGRAIVEGTSDGREARALYDRYVGQ